MAGSLSNIGLGSNGALNYDIIEKLRGVDNSNQVSPIDKKLESNATKLSDLSILTTLTASLKSTTSPLSDELSYLQRSTTVNGDSVSIDVEAGTLVQDFSIDVINLAKSDIKESKAFSTKDALFASGDDTITISIDGDDYTIDVNATTTLAELKDEIFDKTDGKVSASILNVGGSEPYKLILKSTQTGEDQSITISSTGDAVTNLEITDIQSASDASFLYNGVSISRDSNSFDDLIIGVKITLNQIGVSNVSVKQETTDIVGNLENFVSKYNELISNLNESTKYDTDTKLSGTFQGVSEIVTMKSAINRQILSVNEKGRSLADYGIKLNENGMLEIDKSAINNKLESDSKDVESFFRGTSETDTGIFSKLNDTLKNLISDDNSTLSLYEQNLERQSKALQTEREKTIERLDAKYGTMAARFMAYDSIIGKLNSQFQSLSMMIEAAYADK